MNAPWIRVAIAAASLALAALLLWPAPAPKARVTWEDLIAPLAPGAPITRGYTLSPPRRGEEGDVVFTARREAGERGPAARIEVHVLDRGRWQGVHETKSFGVAYETPRSTAPNEDLEAVRDAIEQAIARNDAGLGPVSSIALSAEEAPPLALRVLERLEGARGLVVSALVSLALGLVGSLGGGDAIVAAALFALGLALRVANLDLPFSHDQDVQRVFTGALPLSEILTGKGLEDRHPPLYFVVLHAAGIVGRSEAAMRLPAAIAGAMIGPAIVWGARLVRGRAGAVGAVMGLVVAVSPSLVDHARQVSEIPLFGLLTVLTCVLAVRSSEKPTRLAQIGLAVTTALSAWTYYLAPLVIAGVLGGLVAARSRSRAAIVSMGIGALFGAPAFVLLGVTALRDHGARDVAERFPDLAWGHRAPLPMLVGEFGEAIRCVGPGVPLLAFVALLVGLRSPRWSGSIVAALVSLVTALGVALASKVARVQTYYFAAVAPTLALSVALVPRTWARSWSWTIFGVAALSMMVAAPWPSARRTYLPDADAFMPRFTKFVMTRPEARVVTVAHYDATLFAYYLERAVGAPVSWPRSDASGAFVVPGTDKRIVPLVKVHAMEEGSDEAARERLVAVIAEGPTLVIERDAFVLGPVHDELARCEVLMEAPSGRLYTCGEGGARGR